MAKSGVGLAEKRLRSALTSPSTSSAHLPALRRSTGATRAHNASGVGCISRRVSQKRPSRDSTAPLAASKQAHENGRGAVPRPPWPQECCVRVRSRMDARFDAFEANDVAHNARLR